MTADMPSTANGFPERGSLAGSDAWDVVDRLEELQMRLEAEEFERQLEATVLRMRRRIQSEQRRQAQRQRNRRC